MYAGEQGESMKELVSDLREELTSWLDEADTSSFAKQQGMASSPDSSFVYGDYTRTALYAFESILKDAEHDLNKQMTWKPIEAEKADWLYSSHEETDAARGCIGHLRGDFGRSGTEFWTSWFDHSPKLNNEEFRQEFQTIVDGLRNEGGLLSGFSSMRKGCSYDGALGNVIMGIVLKPADTNTASAAFRSAGIITSTFTAMTRKRSGHIGASRKRR